MWPDVKENPLRSLKLKQNPRFGVCQRSTKSRLASPIKFCGVESEHVMFRSLPFLSHVWNSGLNRIRAEPSNTCFFVKPGDMVSLRIGCTNRLTLGVGDSLVYSLQRLMHFLLKARTLRTGLLASLLGTGILRLTTWWSLPQFFVGRFFDGRTESDVVRCHQTCSGPTLSLLRAPPARPGSPGSI